MTHNPIMSRERVVIPPRRVLTKAERTRVWNAAKGICWWCGKPVAPEGLTVQYDHRDAREWSGNDALDNYAPMHTRPCHLAKTTGQDLPIITKIHRQERKLTHAKTEKRSGFRQHPTLVRGVDGRVRERRT